MIKRSKQSGLTLVEMTVVVGAVALLAVLGLPAIKKLMHSMEASVGARTLINSALANAKATAVKERKCTGVRFQQDINGDQYLTLIIHDQAATGLAPGFRAVKGFEPIKLPRNVRVADLHIRTNHSSASVEDSEKIDSGHLVDDYVDINGNTVDPQTYDEPYFHVAINDITCFSIVFSPSGKLVIRNVRVRNTDGQPDPDTQNDSADQVFNGYDNIMDNNIGLLLQDDYAEVGLGEEKSRNSFIIYDKKFLEGLVDETVKYNYLDTLQEDEKKFVNPYTGRIIGNNN